MSTQAQMASSSSETDSKLQNLKQSGMDFHSRLNEAAGEVSYRKLGRLTETHPETVRRYMQGQAPSATFLTNLCRVLGISGEWLLTGKGPMKCTEVRSHALSQADPSELMTAVANTLTDLCDRLDRLELFVQTLETRVRGSSTNQQGTKNKGPKATKLSPAGKSTNSKKADTTAVALNSEGAKLMIEKKNSPTKDDKAGAGAQRIRDAIANRPT